MLSKIKNSEEIDNITADIEDKLYIASWDTPVKNNKLVNWLYLWISLSFTLKP